MTLKDLKPGQTCTVSCVKEGTKAIRHRIYDMGVTPGVKITMVKVAPLEDPNSGKTTLFNELTGSTQHVGNWPGVPTVLAINMRDEIDARGDKINYEEIETTWL